MQVITAAETHEHDVRLRPESTARPLRPHEDFTQTDSRAVCVNKMKLNIYPPIHFIWLSADVFCSPPRRHTEMFLLCVSFSLFSVTEQLKLDHFVWIQNLLNRVKSDRVDRSNDVERKMNLSDKICLRATEAGGTETDLRTVWTLAAIKHFLWPLFFLKFNWNLRNKLIRTEWNQSEIRVKSERSVSAVCRFGFCQQEVAARRSSSQFVAARRSSSL